MNKKQYGLNIIIALIAGMIGGVITSQFSTGEAAFAEKTPKSEEINAISADRFNAKLFAVEDDEGKTRALLGYIGEFRTFLDLFDKTGSAGISILMGEPTITLTKKNRLGIKLVVDDDGDPSLQLHDKNGNLRLALGSIELKQKQTGAIIKRSPSSLVLFDEDGKVFWSTP